MTAVLGVSRGGRLGCGTIHVEHLWIEYWDVAIVIVSMDYRRSRGFGRVESIIHFVERWGNY